MLNGKPWSDWGECFIVWCNDYEEEFCIIVYDVVIIKENAIYYVIPRRMQWNEMCKWL